MLVGVMPWPWPVRSAPVRVVPHGEIARPDAGRIGLTRGQPRLAVVEKEIEPAGKLPAWQPDPGGERASSRIVALDVVIQLGTVGEFEAQVECLGACQPATIGRRPEPAATLADQEDEILRRLQRDRLGREDQPTT